VARLKNRLGLPGFNGIDSDGLSGGLALFWHESVHVEIKKVTERFIDAHIRTSSADPVWHAMFVYGEPRVENRHRMWSALCDLKASSSLPWSVMGDFNEALWQYEHFSICLRPESQMMAFRDALMICGLKDLGFKGLPYTYDNRRAGQSNVCVRLDRAMADDSWRDIFTEVSVVHLVSPCSDHCPVLVQLGREEREMNGRKCLNYEILWERDGALPEVIKSAWSNAGVKEDMGDVHAALKNVMDTLHMWGSKKFGNITRELARMRRKIESLMTGNAPRNEIRDAMDKMNELLYKEEMLWLQRSRIEWLREGDRNTRFFHNKAVWRAKKNRIKSLKDEDGVVQNTPTEME
jgi:hypothetical protein